MKQKLTPRWVIIKLTGILFAVYSAYYIFVIIRDIKRLPPEGIIISGLVVLLFAVLAAFAWTTEVRNIRFQTLRKMVFLLVLLIIFALKLRMAGGVISYLDFSMAYTVLFGCSYLVTQIALLILFIYYAYILKSLLLFPKAPVILAISAIVLFLSGLVLEMILLFAFGIGLEENALRTLVSRPVFYLGFIGLSVYFLFPPKLTIAGNNEFFV